VEDATNESVGENAVFLENRYGEWEMLVDDPFHEFLVGEVWLAVVGDGVFQALAFA
jgi:hypothetical protein